jgi:4-amino-4-deoxy-L-arabinose transferase-like glycosyltransferase
MKPRSHYILIALLLTAGFFLRIDVAFRNPVAGGDEREYVGMAFSLLFKGRLENVEFPASLRSFFYPVYLAAFLGVSRPLVSLFPLEVPSVIFNAPAYLLKWILVSRVFNVLISTLVIYITYLLGRNLFDRNIGLLAAFIGVVNPTSIAVAGTALAENSQALFVATSFLLLLQRRSLLTAGILMGFGYLCRFQTALYLLPVLFLLRDDRTSFRDFLVGFFAAALVIGGLLDYLAYGSFFVSSIKTLRWALITRQPGHKTVPIELLWIQVPFVFGPTLYLALENIRKDMRILSLWSPILINLVFFTFIRAKDPRYICDLIPFLSVLCAEGALSNRRHWRVLVFLVWSFIWYLVLWIYSPEVNLV